MSINPQKENGYTPIANEILEALSRFRIPGESWQVLSVILRKTYGWNKKYATISNAEFANITGMSRQNVYRSLSKLIDNRIIKKDNSGYISRYSFNKHYDDWGRRCFLCKSYDNIHRHHLIFKKIEHNNTKSDKSSPTADVCAVCHSQIHQYKITEKTMLDVLKIEDTKLHSKWIAFKNKPESKMSTPVVKSEYKTALNTESLKSNKTKEPFKTIDRSRKNPRSVLKISFAKKILRNKEKFPPELLKDFYSWWTDTDGKVYRFETDKMFDVEKMLLRYEPSWRKRNFKPKERIKKDRPVEAIIADMQPSFDYLATMHDAVQTVQPNERPRVMEYFIKRGLTNDDFTKEPKDCIKKMENHKTD